MYFEENLISVLATSQASKPNPPVAIEITRNSGPSMMGQKNL